MVSRRCRQQAAIGKTLYDHGSYCTCMDCTSMHKNIHMYCAVGDINLQN